MPKILVADDNANIQKMVVLAFEERGIQVVTVGNGEAAVRRIPDLSSRRYFHAGAQWLRSLRIHKER